MQLKDNSRDGHNSWNQQTDTTIKKNTTIKLTIQLTFSDNVTIYRLRSSLQMYTGFYALIAHCTATIVVQQFHCSIFSKSVAQTKATTQFGVNHLYLQLTSCQGLVPAKNMLHLQWEDLSLCLGSPWGLLSTDKLTQTK